MRQPARERIQPENISDKLWNQALVEAGPDNMAIHYAHLAGKAALALEILQDDRRHSHDHALDALNEARQLEGE